MDTKITSVHFSADEKLENFINDKISKFTQFDEQLLSTDVNLTLEKPIGKNFDSKVVKIKVLAKGYDFFAEKKGETFEAATDEAVDAILIQIKKRKEKNIKK